MAYGLKASSCDLAVIVHAVNLPLKLSPATVANSDTGSQVSPYISLKMFVPYASEI